jgi:hypothetical protein
MVELLATPEKDMLFQSQVDRRAAAAQLGVYPCNHLQIEPLSGSLKVSKAYNVNHTSADSQKSWQYWGAFAVASTCIESGLLMKKAKAHAILVARAAAVARISRVTVGHYYQQGYDRLQ